jgi:CubicO group peptidase (beta-lactamase class C family)
MVPKIRTFIIGILCACFILSACSLPEATQPGITSIPSSATETSTTATATATAPTAATAVATIPAIALAEPTGSLIQPGVMDEIEAWLTQMSQDGDFTGSVLVAQDGVVLLSKGYGLADREQGIQNTPQTRFRLGSVTKQFTAMAILILQQQGKLDVQDPICQYIDACPQAWQAITIHHLLTHTSGIHNFTNMLSYRRFMAEPTTPEQTMDVFKDLPLDFQPGERFKYSNSGYIVLGSIIERVSGQTYEAFLQQAIFTPLNMDNSGYEHPDSGVAVGYGRDSTDKSADFIDMSVPYAAGALYSTVEDMLLWDQALYTEQLLPQSMLQLMFTRHASMGEDNLSYGYGWMIMEDDQRTIFQHGGGINGFRSLIVRYPEEKVLVVILSNQENTAVEEVWSFVDKKLFGEP